MARILVDVKVDLRQVTGFFGSSRRLRDGQSGGLGQGGRFVLDLTAGSEETRERCESIQGRWGVDFLEAWQDRSE
jgi:hypothetical protein